MDAAELVAWFRIIQTDPYYGTTIQARFELAADTIERLQKERDQLGAGGKVWQRTAGKLKSERDAALAEIQELHQKTFDDLAAAKAEVERLKAELLQARRDCMGDLEKRYQWGML